MFQLKFINLTLHRDFKTVNSKRLCNNFDNLFRESYKAIIKQKLINT